MRGTVRLFGHPNRPRNVSIIEGLELFREPKTMGHWEANQQTDEPEASTGLLDRREIGCGAT
jgi:hypothetical protein